MRAIVRRGLECWVKQLVRVSITVRVMMIMVAVLSQHTRYMVFQNARSYARTLLSSNSYNITSPDR